MSAGSNLAATPTPAQQQNGVGDNQVGASCESEREAGEEREDERLEKGSRAKSSKSESAKSESVCSTSPVSGGIWKIRYAWISPEVVLLCEPF